MLGCFAWVSCALVMMPDQDCKKLIAKRGGVKHKITNIFERYHADPSPGQAEICRKAVDDLLKLVHEYDEKIGESYLEDSLVELSEDYKQELVNQSDYTLEIGRKLSNLNCSPNVPSESKHKSEAEGTNFSLKLPHLDCPSFSGEGTSHFEYYAFINQFQNVIGLRTNLAESTKLTYLRSFLKGYALKTIQYLSITDQNYTIALNLLNEEFLDKEALADDLYKKFLNMKPKFEQNYLGTKVYLSDVKCLLKDLNNYDRDLLKDKTSKEFISHIVFNRLPTSFKKELVRKLDSNYPTIDEIFDNSKDIVRTLNMNYSENPNKSFKQNQIRGDGAKPKETLHTLAPEKPVLYHNVNTVKKNDDKFSRGKFCKLCSENSHGLFTCRKYDSHDSRKKRCEELGLCGKCSSSKHVESQCDKEMKFPCTICDSKSHISGLCGDFKPKKLLVNWSINSFSAVTGALLLPIISILISFNNCSTMVNCLLDTGSQRSYLAGGVANRLNCDYKGVSSKFLVNTFLDKAYKSFSEIFFSIKVLGTNEYLNLPLLIDQNFNIDFSVEGLSDALKNIKNSYNVPINSFGENSVKLEGLLGVDFIQFLADFRITKCLNGSAFSFSDLIVPFGSINLFLPETRGSAVTVESETSNSCSSTLINFLTNPVGVNFDPIGNIVSNSFVEPNLDKLFSLETLGISENYSISDLDFVSEFEKNLKHTGERYYVKIPWYEEKLNYVQSNFNVALKVMEKVYSDLKEKNLVEAYDDVINQQLTDGILEEIPFDKCDHYNHVWIPHRAVIKTEDNVTTKLRIVLNCSFKVGKNLSLNQAAFPGIDLLGCLFNLLLLIRSNLFIVVSDIHKAFLQIFLRDDDDKRKFSILWRNGDEIKCFFYKTIVFGFVSSPFILNFVIRHHVSKFPKDLCSDILNNNFYVDNLFYTGCDQQSLIELYRSCYNRMKEGGFDLRGWISNGEIVQGQFSADGRSSTHNLDYEKLLGYRYFPKTDMLKLNKFEIKVEEVITKRVVLSLLARLFDPLGFTLPCLVKIKVLLRSLWLKKLDWDVTLSSDDCNIFKKFCSDASKLFDLGFARRCYDTSTEVTMIIFCDASRVMYGFASYVRTVHTDSVENNLLFSKVKSAPLKGKSLPTLELMAVFLAFKCIKSLFAAVSCTIKDIYICIDAQIVLSWILSEKVKSKNIFADNRVKDILKFKSELEQEFKVKFHFKYTPSESNCSDMITRGLSYKEFVEKMESWIHGPTFLKSEPIVWPVSQLNCLSEASKVLTYSTIIEPSYKILNLESFSDLNVVFRVTALVFIFISRLRKLNPIDQCIDQAKMYWLKVEQKICFKTELEFLLHPSKNVPNLVKNLNLFLDENGLVRSQGRLKRCDKINYNLCNPIVLPRDSNLTKLYVWFFHEKTKHLGVNSTLNCLRNHGFWIPKGRIVVKSVISDCILCRKMNCLPFKYPKVTDFIADRVNYVRPFRYTGVDFTGHFFVSYGGKVVKMYICIFTCLNIRAVHFELLPNMSTESFLLCFVRFVNLFNIPETIFSDNANTFLSAMNILSKSQSDNNFFNYLIKNNIGHKKIPLYAAWCGSAWERLLRTLKSCLYKSIGKKKLEYFEFITLLSDIQESMNSRPLTYQSNDEITAVTPNCFLKCDVGKHLIFGPNNSFPSSRGDLIKSLEARDEILDSFRNRFYDEYLLGLREHGRDLYDGVWENYIAPGDIVLIGSENRIRPHWSLARVLDLLPGEDGKVRSVRLIKPDRSEGIYTINQLYPLELSLADVSKPTDLPQEDPEENPRSLKRPVRQAALKCKRILNQSN